MPDLLGLGRAGYAYAPLVAFTRGGWQIGGRLPRAILGRELGPWNAASIAGHAAGRLAWFADIPNDPRVIEIAPTDADRDATLTARAVAALESQVGRSLNRAQTFRALVRDLVQPKASYTRQGKTIWLGPEGRGKNLFDFQPEVVPRGSEGWYSAFPEADGALNGNAVEFASTGTPTWADAGGLFTVSGNTIVASGVAGPGSAAVNLCTTDIERMLGTISGFTRSTGTLVIGVTCRDDGSIGNGYMMTVTAFGGTDLFELYELAGFSVIDDTTATAHTGDFEVIYDGADAIGQLGGATVLGPTSDSGASGGSGNRKTGVIYFSDAAGNSAALDYVEGRDGAYTFPTGGAGGPLLGGRLLAGGPLLGGILIGR